MRRWVLILCWCFCREEMRRDFRYDFAPIHTTVPENLRREEEEEGEEEEEEEERERIGEET